MRRFSLCLVAVGSMLAARGKLPADSLVVAGGGTAGKWDTEIAVANPTADTLHVELSIVGPPLGMPCPPNCTARSYDVPGHGAIRVLASDFIGAIFPGPQMIHVDSQGPLPVVHARAISSASAAQFAELPVTRLSSILALDTSVLVFPGAARAADVYSNLILETLGSDATPTAEVLVEVFDSGGQLVGSRPLTVSREGGFQALTLLDVVGAAGATALDGGQVRVTRTSGGGALWGVLATVFTEGYLEVSLGANP